MALNIPNALKKGDTMAVVCPSYFLQQGGTSINDFQKWIINKGFKLELGRTTEKRFFKFAGTDEERVEDLQYYLNSKEVKVIWMGRGGYGLTRIIDKLDFSMFTENPKWIVGFSDITCLLSHVLKFFYVPSIHGSMAGSVQQDLAESGGNILTLLTQNKIEYDIAPHPYNKLGKVRGQLVGGNLSVINAMLSTPSLFDFRDKILFLEDTPELPHHLDRMLGTLSRGNYLSQIKGLVIGNFGEVEEKAYLTFGKKPFDIINSYFEESKIPICFNFPAGHTERNMPIIIGGQTTLEVSEDKVVFSNTV